MQRHLETGARGVNWRAARVTARHRDGHELPVEIALSDLYMEGERVFVAFIRDISERREAERVRESLESQLRESQKMQAVGTLAGGIAHDFNNLLGAMLGNVQLAMEEAEGRPHLQQSLEEIRKAGHRARELVRQILAFGRRQPSARRPSALLPIIEESVLMLRASLPAQVAIDVHCAADVPLVLADAVQVEQVLLNLGVNAAYAMEDQPGRIEVSIEPVVIDAASVRVHGSLRPGRYARVSCSDTGCGMDAATLGRIFEPFFTTKPVGEGTGLGLSVAHGILSAHGGAIVAHSEPGRGSRFDLYFPAVEGAAAAPAPALPGVAAKPVAGAGQHILYVDDEEGLVFLVKRMLERRGYRVSGFVDARSALEALRADPAGFDLVVTDQNMPGMSGLEVAREVRAIRPDLPVALASGYITEELKSQAPAAGVRELIFKEDVVEEFCEVVQRLVSPR
jgi:two-component system cell cycle sensor histidine kinase/response regulator CckA